MQIGVCTPLANAALARGAGADFVEEHIQNFLMPERDEAAFAANRAAARAASLPVKAANCFLPGALKCVGPSVDLPRIERYAEVAFRRAADIGIQVLVFGSGGSRALPDGFPKEKALDQFVELLRRLGPIATANRLVLVVEPLNRGECNFLHTVAEGAEVVSRCGHPGVRLLADIFHMTRNGETPDDLARHGHLLSHVHIAENEKRSAPGVKGDDFRPFLRALKQAGYDQRLAVECAWGDLKAELPRCVRTLRQQLAEAEFA